MKTETGQMKLQLIGGESRTATVRKSLRSIVKKAAEAFAPWKQMRLKLYIKTIFKQRTGFYWTRPDGKQFFCRSVRQLMARVMDYDGHLLMATLRKLANA